MEIMNVAGLKSHLSEVLAKVSETGEPILVGRYGVPVAKIIPYTADRKNQRKVGFGKHLLMANSDKVQRQVDAALDEDTFSGFYS